MNTYTYVQYNNRHFYVRGTHGACYGYLRTARSEPHGLCQSAAATAAAAWGQMVLERGVFTINSARYYLWRAVDQDDNVLDILVQSRRHKKAAKQFFKKLLKGLQYVPRVLITDKLKSYAAAKREVMLGVEHRQSHGLNNRWEHSHRPTRERERRMQRFKSPGPAQRFLAAYGPIA